MTAQPCPQSRDSLAGRRPLLQGAFPLHAVVRCVEVAQVVVAEGMYGLVDDRGDDHLYDVAIRGPVHLYLGGRGRHCPPPGPPGAPYQDRGGPRAGARHPHGHSHLVHDFLQRGDEVRAPRMVGVLPWGKHRRAPPPGAPGASVGSGPWSPGTPSWPRPPAGPTLGPLRSATSVPTGPGPDSRVPTAPRAGPCGRGGRCPSHVYTPGP